MCQNQPIAGIRPYSTTPGGIWSFLSVFAIILAFFDPVYCNPLSIPSKRLSGFPSPSPFFFPDSHHLHDWGMLPALLSSLLVASALPATTNAFDLVRDYSGTNFFQGWDFYGSWDNLTLGACSSPPRLKLTFLTIFGQAMCGG